MTPSRITAPRRSRRLRAWMPALGLVALAAGMAGAGPVAQVLRLRSAPVRNEPGFEKGADADTVYLGQRVEVIDKKDDWRKIRFESAKAEKSENAEKDPKAKLEKFKEGWLHASALAEPAAGAAAGAPQPWVREGAAALPHFDGEHSKAARHAEARKLKLGAILELEQCYPSARELDAFLKEGKLGLYRTDWPALAPEGEAKASEKKAKPDKAEKTEKTPTDDSKKKEAAK